MTPLISTAVSTILCMAASRASIVWLYLMIGQPFELFRRNLILFHAALFTVVSCFTLFQNATIRCDPAILIVPVALVAVAVVFGLSVAGGYMGECLASFALEEKRGKK